MDSVCTTWYMVGMLVCHACGEKHEDPGEPLEAFRCGHCGKGPLERVADDPKDERDELVAAAIIGAVVFSAVGGIFGLTGAVVGGILGLVWGVLERYLNHQRRHG